MQVGHPGGKNIASEPVTEKRIEGSQVLAEARGAANEQILIGSTGEFICPRSSDQDVSAAAARERILSAAPDQHIPIVGARERVACRASQHNLNVADSAGST